MTVGGVSLWLLLVVVAAGIVWRSSGKPPVKLETTYRYLGEIECVLQSIYSGAKVFHPEMMKLSEEVSRQVYETNRYKKLPEWAQEKVSYAHQMIRKNVIDNYIWLFYVGLDGRKIPTYKAWDTFTEEEKEFIRGGGHLPIQHIWMKETMVRHDDGTIVKTLVPTNRVYWKG